MTTLEPRTTLTDARRIALPQAPAQEGTSNNSERLLAAVQAAVRGVPGDMMQAVCRADAGLAYQPRSLLALLSYFYAAGIYSSADIEESMCRDCEFRRVCGGEFPGPKTLRAFRRNNREVLERCVCNILRAVDEFDGRTRSEPALRDDAHVRLQTAVAMDMAD